MSWNHRVVRHKTTDTFDGKEEVYYLIHEVYYNSDGSVCSMTKEGMAPHGETLDELKKDLEWMTSSLAHPVLDYDMEFATPDWENDIDEDLEDMMEIV